MSASSASGCTVVVVALLASGALGAQAPQPGASAPPAPPAGPPPDAQTWIVIETSDQHPEPLVHCSTFQMPEDVLAIYAPPVPADNPYCRRERAVETGGTTRTMTKCRFDAVPGKLITHTSTLTVSPDRRTIVMSYETVEETPGGAPEDQWSKLRFVFGACPVPMKPDQHTAIIDADGRVTDPAAPR